MAGQSCECRGVLQHLCLGDNSFASTLETTIAGESINGKRVLMKRVAKPQDSVGCRILFISSSQQTRLKEILAELDNASVLTVSDMPEFTRRGGMIQFVVEATKCASRSI